jgi:uncharacterized membrane protein YkvA (DUF1232 family)
MRSGGSAWGDGFKNLRLLMHLPNLVKLYWRLFKDRRVNLVPKLVLVAGLIYLLVPIDALVDLPFVIPGYLDDMAVMYLALRAFIKLCPPNVVREHVMLIDQGA